jgi:hypothetical protein
MSPEQIGAIWGLIPGTYSSDAYPLGLIFGESEDYLYQLSLSFDAAQLNKFFVSRINARIGKV